MVSTTKRNDVRIPVALFAAKCQYDQAKADIATAVSNKKIRSFISVHSFRLSTTPVDVVVIVIGSLAAGSMPHAEFRGATVKVKALIRQGQKRGGSQP
jgi:hypothetical protein